MFGFKLYTLKAKGKERIFDGIFKKQFWLLELRQFSGSNYTHLKPKEL